MDDVIASSPKKGMVADLIKEFTECSPGSNQWNCLEDSDNVRFARWDNQSDDFKKHNTETADAFPWDGASDQRVLFADGIIGEQVAVCCTAFWRSIVRAQPVEGGDDAQAATTQTLLDYYVRNRLAGKLAREVELSANYMKTYGHVILHPTWEREVSLRYKEVTLEMLKAAGDAVAAGDPTHPLADVEGLVLDPVLEEQAIQVFGDLYRMYVQQNLQAVLPGEAPPLKDGVIRKALKDLRKRGVCKMPLPYILKNEPTIVALKPWHDVFISRKTTDIQKARVFVRYSFTEEELKEKELVEGWDNEWVEKACELKGHSSAWSSSNGFQETYGWSMVETTDDDLIEVIYAYTRRYDENGVPGVFCTIFHPQITKAANDMELCAKHGMIEFSHGLMPFVEGMNEQWDRALASSRGVPEISSGWQHETKVHRDSLLDLTTMGVLPPILEPAGSVQAEYRYGPAVRNKVIAGREPRFMDVPHRGAPVALGLMDVVEREADNYFGRLSDKVPAPRAQAKQQMMVQGFLNCWTAALRQMFMLVEQYTPDSEWERITGSAPVHSRDPVEVSGQFDLSLTFDVRELDIDFTLAKLDAISKMVIPEDAAGVVDRAKLTQRKLMAIDPSYARELVTNQSKASQQLFESVRNEIAQMFLGNEPVYVEQDPTAPTKLQYASQVVAANPTYQQALQQNERFAELMKKYAQNLAFSIQQEQNKQTGRIGVQSGGAQ